MNHLEGGVVSRKDVGLKLLSGILSRLNGKGTDGRSIPTPPKFGTELVPTDEDVSDWIRTAA